MEGQLSLFPEKTKPSGKSKKKREKKEADPFQTYEERRKRFLHYMETKGMNEQWIEMAEGEIRIIIDALADYCDIVGRNVETMDTGYPKVAWENRTERIKQIQTKLEESIGYDRDKQLEICNKRKRKQSKDDDIGEDALILASRR